MNTATEAVALRIARAFSEAEVVGDAAVLERYEVDDLRPGAAIFPRSSADISDILQFAASEKMAVIACGSRTKLGIGSPPHKYDVALDLSRLNRVLSYEPRDLTLGVEPGVTISALSEVLAAENQFLPLDPPFAASATIGGIIASDSVSPLRQRFGGPRDFVLGMEFVTGYGAQSKSGGRVVKNVTGYDLHKPLIGSLGTLAVITRINLKTFPIPQSRAGFSIMVPKLSDVQMFFQAIADSPLEPIALAAFSSGAEISRSRSGSGSWNALAVTAGNDAVVTRYRRDFSTAVTRIPGAEMAELGPSEFNQNYEFVREFPRLAKESSASAVVFRIAALPAAIASVIERLQDALQRAEVNCDVLAHAFGLIYFAVLPDRNVAMDRLGALAAEVFQLVVDAGAQARIEFGPTALKRVTRVWGPARADFELMARVKRTFDPENILSPGRFVEGM
ncbi:MAG TPA: FAD-binding oxidoreductase [Candidatus Acidoferrales bacterium]|nr:FAD-binding oxidoreductase [Candidatus Acidoferrales bacterium]